MSLLSITAADLMRSAKAAQCSAAKLRMTGDGA